MTKEEAKRIGATHIREYTGQYFKIKNNEWFVLVGDAFKKYQSTRFINIKPL